METTNVVMTPKPPTKKENLVVYVTRTGNLILRCKHEELNGLCKECRIKGLTNLQELVNR